MPQPPPPPPSPISNYYPSPDDYKDPVRLERAVRRLYDENYRLRERVRELEAAVRAMTTTTLGTTRN